MGTIRCTRKELAAGLKVPLDERTKIIVGPDAAIAVVKGRAFDANRSFVLPRALGSLGSVHGFGLPLEPKHALVVVHCRADVGAAEELSSERAEICAAWLESNPDPWLARFEESVPDERRWGAREDSLMLRTVPDFPRPVGRVSAPSPNAASSAQGDPVVRAYQEARGLSVDGIAGPITRRQLITDYIAFSKTAEIAGDGSGPEREGLNVEVRFHGGGSHFPMAAVREQGESSTVADPEAQSATGGDEDDRIEFIFFMAESGIEPAPAAADGPEYFEWRELASIEREFSVFDNQRGGGTQLSIRLLDKTGEVEHSSCRYTIHGPESFDGVTDDSGVADHDDVLPGDYVLTLTLEFLEGPHQIVDTYTTTVVVAGGDKDPQVRLIGAVPRCELARLRGLLFETNKAFLLPSALEGMRKIRSLYEKHNPGKLLVVGHTDTTADASINDPLSLERAEATVAFLEDDVDVWLEFYETKVPESRRWGTPEDSHMLAAVAGLTVGEITEETVRHFQASRGLEVDGDPGRETRGVLIKEYMLLDGIELDSAEFDIEATAHGCGENFPVDDTGEAVDENPEGEKEDALDRRVELFFFDTEFGIIPPPRGKNSRKGSTEYPAWRQLAELSLDTDLGGAIRRLSLRMLDAADQPVVGLEFTIAHSQGSSSGVTDSEGLVKADVPEDDTQVALTISGQTTTIELSREFASVEEVLGCQQRLSNLGYSAPSSGTFDEETKQAVLEYQKDRDGLTVTGELDAPTKASLEQVYGS